MTPEWVDLTIYISKRKVTGMLGTHQIWVFIVKLGLWGFGKGDPPLDLPAVEGGDLS